MSSPSSTLKPSCQKVRCRIAVSSSGSGKNEGQEQRQHRCMVGDNAGTYVRPPRRDRGRRCSRPRRSRAYALLQRRCDAEAQGRLGVQSGARLYKGHVRSARILIRGERNLGDVLCCPPEQIADQISTRSGPGTIWVLHGDTTRRTRGEERVYQPLRDPGQRRRRRKAHLRSPPAYQSSP